MDIAECLNRADHAGARAAVDEALAGGELDRVRDALLGHRELLTGLTPNQVVDTLDRWRPAFEVCGDWMFSLELLCAQQSLVASSAGMARVSRAMASVLERLHADVLASRPLPWQSEEPLWPVGDPWAEPTAASRAGDIQAEVERLSVIADLFEPANPGSPRPVEELAERLQARLLVANDFLLEELAANLSIPPGAHWFERVFGVPAAPFLDRVYRQFFASQAAEVLGRLQRLSHRTLRLTGVTAPDDTEATGTQRVLLRAMREPVPLFTLVVPDAAGMEPQSYGSFVLVEGDLRWLGKMNLLLDAEGMGQLLARLQAGHGAGFDPTPYAGDTWIDAWLEHIARSPGKEEGPTA